MAQASTAAYLAKVRARLESAGYTWLDTGSTFAGAARLKRFQATKFGMWETFFVFREFQQLDHAALQAFMREASGWAFENRSVSLPRGLFAGVAAFGVAIAQSVDKGATRSVLNDKPPKHWAAIEMPVVYDVGANRLLTFEKTPFWGAAYYRGLRKQITELLAP